MPIMVGIWFALAGGVAMLAGLSGMRRVRRLRRDGVTAWAMVVPLPVAEGEQAGRAPSPRRALIQYRLSDGRVVERIAPRRAGRAASLRPGEKVLVWYAPEDPQDVLVYGREGRLADQVFLAAGALFLLAGTGTAAFLH
jgi:Protein of unknown function (DUF3592)